MNILVKGQNNAEMFYISEYSLVYGTNIGDF